MSSKNEADRGMVFGAIFHCDIFIRMQLNRFVPLFLMCRDEVQKEQENYFIESLSFANCLWMIRCFCEVLTLSKAHIVARNLATN